MYLQNVLNLIN